MKIRKFFLDPFKKEEWINTRLEEGYQLTEINGMNQYVFEKTDKPHVVRIDYRTFGTRHKFDEYMTIHEDMGWQLIKGSRFNSTYIWEKVKDGNDILVSDKDSARALYQRYMSYAIALAVTYLIILFSSETFKALFNVKSLFKTPGLWSKEGNDFWNAFLLELPAVAIRLGIIGVLFVAAVYFFWLYMKAKRYYNRI